jgi:prepilin-type N-terminal cleavage/methylation domain-containing protein
MRIKNTQKGFTLIELMIVIAIISVLAVTLVPQLTWAQARSRDAGRVSSLKNITAVLETYYSDEGQFPAVPLAGSSTTANGCFSDANGKVNTALSELLKWGTSPVDPQATNKVGDCNTVASFGYKVLAKSGITNASYILVANVETYKKANANWDTIKSATTHW